MANVGDKFVIEIDKILESEENGETVRRYKAKGFSTLVFDDFGLKKLMPYDDPNEIQIGDEVKNTTTGKCFVVTRIDRDRLYGIDQGGGIYYAEPANMWEKTSRRHRVYVVPDCTPLPF